MMTESLTARSKDESTLNIEEIYTKYARMIFQISFSYMKNTADAEDIAADVFVKLISSKKKFQSEEHEKAWLLRAAINLCKNNLKHWRRKTVDINDINESENSTDFYINDTMKAVMDLPERYKAVIYLYYYEGYSTAEIAEILKKPHSTIRVHLHEARKILKEVLEDEE